MGDPVSGSIIAAELAPTVAASIPALASTTALAAPFAAATTASTLPGVVSQAAPFVASSNPFVSALGQGQIVGGMTGSTNAIGGNTLLGSETLGGVWKDITAANDWMNRNQMATQLGMKAASSMMQQPQVHFTQPGQIQRGQVQPMDYMSLLNPQQQTVIQNKPISLI